jgi:hypothetical protein
LIPFGVDVLILFADGFPFAAGTLVAVKWSLFGLMAFSQRLIACFPFWSQNRNLKPITVTQALILTEDLA